MRKLIFFMLTSLDGYFEAPGSDISWHNIDEEFNDFAIEQLDSAGGLLFGRVTYEMMAGYWPTPEALADDPVVAGRMNSLPKVVFSKTLPAAGWQNTRLVQDNFLAEVTQLKQQPGKDLFIFGSSDLAVSLMQYNLIDEFRIMVNPIVLGGGKSLFQGIQNKFGLNLLRTRQFKSGNVLLYYAPTGK